LNAKFSGQLRVCTKREYGTEWRAGKRDKEEEEEEMDPKALLDELMGKDRDLPFDQKKKNKLRFDDPEVCFGLVWFAASFCVLNQMIPVACR
jgi:hypothetical protein